MKREIRDKRANLLKKAKGLRELQFDEENERIDKTSKEQNDVYKRYKFYDNIIKTNDKMKKGNIK